MRTRLALLCVLAVGLFVAVPGCGGETTTTDGSGSGASDGAGSSGGGTPTGGAPTGGTSSDGAKPAEKPAGTGKG